MSKVAWEVDMAITALEATNRRDFHSYVYRFEADEKEDVRKKIFSWARKKLSRFIKRNGYIVQIAAAPTLENGSGDITKLLRNRFKFADINSILKVNPANAEKVFVVGYGAKAWNELSR